MRNDKFVENFKLPGDWSPLLGLPLSFARAREKERLMSGEPEGEADSLAPCKPITVLDRSRLSFGAFSGDLTLSREPIVDLERLLSLLPASSSAAPV